MSKKHTTWPTRQPMPPVETQELAVETQTVQVLTPGESRDFWPAGTEMPSEYRRPDRPAYPCPRCKRIRFDGGQVHRVVSLANGMAYMRCRACGHTWKLPMAESDQ